MLPWVLDIKLRRIDQWVTACLHSGKAWSLLAISISQSWFICADSHASFLSLYRTFNLASFVSVLTFSLDRSRGSTSTSTSSRHRSRRSRRSRQRHSHSPMHKPQRHIPRRDALAPNPRPKQRAPARPIPAPFNNARRRRRRRRRRCLRLAEEAAVDRVAQDLEGLHVAVGQARERVAVAGW